MADAKNVVTVMVMLPEFDYEKDDFSISKKRAANFFSANEETVTEYRKRALLLNALSENSYRLLTNLCLPHCPEFKSYAQLVETLGNHFKIITPVFLNRYQFYSACKMGSETPTEWGARLRSLAALCEFSDGICQLANVF